MDVFLKTTAALNDPTRIKILQFINLHGKLCVCDLEISFDMIQSRLSRHLKILKEAGFLSVKREGRWAFYEIRSPQDQFRNECIKEIMYLELYLPKLKKNCKTS